MILRFIVAAMLVCLVVSNSRAAHFYTTDPNGEIAATNGYVKEGVAAYVYTTKQPNTVPMYRWFHAGTRDHLYTTDPAGQVAPSVGYVKELVAFYCYPSAQSDTVPLFRWYSPAYNDHFYTTDIHGEAAPTGGYRQEGIACHVYPTARVGTTPLYRWFIAVKKDFCVTLINNSGEIVFRKTVNATSIDEANRLGANIFVQYNAQAIEAYRASSVRVSGGGC